MNVKQLVGDAESATQSELKKKKRLVIHTFEYVNRRVVVLEC